MTQPTATVTILPLPRDLHVTTQGSHIQQGWWGAWGILDPGLLSGPLTCSDTCRKTIAYELQSAFSRKEQNSFCVLTPPPALPSHFLREQPLSLAGRGRGDTAPRRGLTASVRQHAGHGMCPWRMQLQFPHHHKFGLSPWNEPENEECSQVYSFPFLRTHAWGTFFCAEPQMSLFTTSS